MQHVYNKANKFINTQRYKRKHETTKKDEMLIVIVPLMKPRTRSPMKKGKKHKNLHKEVQTPVGGSISNSS